MKRALLLLGLAGTPLVAQSPEWTAILAVRPDPTPYIADWESDPLIVTLVLSYSGNANVAFYLDGRIVRGATPIVGGRSTAFEFVRPTQLLLTTRDGIWDRNSVTYESALRDLIERTGRIPDGEYQFCVDVRQGTPEAGGGALLAQDCASFSITAPQPPSLVAPADNDSIAIPYPTFVWTPVSLGANAQVNYHVRIAPVLPGQSPLEALNNVPQLEADVTTSLLRYPQDALPLDDSVQYVWQVQALDALGQPVGERQGKSEAWTFVRRSSLGPIALADSGAVPDAEPAVGHFRWAGLEVKVLSLQDSSRENYTGVGRIRVIPNVFEPSFEFRHVRLENDGSRVRTAPRHLIDLPTGTAGLEWVVKELPPNFFIDVRQLVLVADSGAPQYAGINGLASLFVGFGLVDSLIDAGPLALKYNETCEDQTAAEAALGPPVCNSAFDWDSDENEEALTQAGYLYADLLSRSLVFGFKRLGIASDGPRGTLRLARDFSSGVFGVENAKLTLKADSTVLVLQGDAGMVDLAGSFRFPPGIGLMRDKPDTTWKDDKKTEVRAIDSTVTVGFSHGRIDTHGDLFVQTTGIPFSRVGQTGMGIQSGSAWLDLSSTMSRGHYDQSWRGLFIDSVRLFLPRRWHTAEQPPAEADRPGNVQVAGFGVAIDERGLSGEIVGRQLDRLGPISFGGFSGRLDSLRLVFSDGTLAEGYVKGRLRTPFIESDIKYAVGIGPAGIEEAYADVGLGLGAAMPALGAELIITRGAFSYDRPVSTFKMDGTLTLAREGIALKSVRVYNLGISTEGRITMDRAWIGLDQGHEAQFNGFPVAVDSIGFGTDTTTNEVWLGIGGRFMINENLPASNGAFRLFAIKDGGNWRFSRFTVDKLDVRFENAAVSFRALVGYLQNDSVYGNVFAAGVQMSVQNQFSVRGTFIAGVANAGFHYWYVDGQLVLPPPGIQLGPIPLAIWGFAGGAYSRMTATIDSNTLVAQYRPDASNKFGLKAAVSIGTSANSGYIWNADVWLEAAVGTSGGLQSLTMRGDQWMLTEVAQRRQRLWGTVLIDLPVTQPVFHANMVVNVDIPPSLKGSGWAEMHFEPGKWYINVGTPQRPDTLRLLPSTLNIQTAAFLQLDRDRIATGVAVHLHKEKRKGDFKGTIDGGYELAADMRYRSFQTQGEGELWGEISASVKRPGGGWFELLSGTARATMSFRLPDPMGIWGRIKFKYNVLSGTLKGTYRMHYSWGDAPDDGESDTAQFVVVAATYPVSSDTAALLSGFTYYLGMNEGTTYGMDDGVYRLRLSGTPTLEREIVTVTQVRDTRGAMVPRTSTTWQSIGTVIRDWIDDHATLVLKAPGYATLDPGKRYRAKATFVLEKQGSSGWAIIQTVPSVVVFRTAAQAPLLAQLVSETDPAGGATPLYYGGPNSGALRVRFTNTHPDLSSGAVTGRLITAASDTVAGSWATSTYALAAVPRTVDPTLYAFRPAANALAPSTAYRFTVVSTDTSAREHYAMNFVTSRYATLLDHVNQSTRTVTVTRGPGPVTGAGNYTLAARIVLSSAEPITWVDLDSIEVVGLANWTVTPRTRCQWAGGLAPQLSAPLASFKACGVPPVYENVLDVTFSAADDAGLPPATLASITIRVNQRREGWRSFTFALPAAPPPPQPPLTTVDVTQVRR